MNGSQTEARYSYWKQHVEAWQASGQSQRAFCQEHDLDYYRFGYWRKKFRQVCEDDLTGRSSSAFVPVVPKITRGTEELSLTLPNGAVLQGIRADNLTTVCQLLERLS